MSNTNPPQVLSLAEELLHTTVRIECSTANGVFTGTGFFFELQFDKEHSIPLIVTNAHVVQGATTGTFVMTRRSADGLPLIGIHVTVQYDQFESRWIKHPDPDVDLAVFLLNPLLCEAESRGELFFYRTLDEKKLPTAESWPSISVIEDITMIGYPNDVWDQKNNMPIVRRGITATNPRLDFDGAPIFVIDCACFPGSSGSPVLVFNQGSYYEPSGHVLVAKNRVILLGILFAGPQHAAAGEIKTINVPLSKKKKITLSQIPNHLGFVVKSERLYDFLPLLKKKLGAEIKKLKPMAPQQY